jgi:hypothetical protein
MTDLSTAITTYFNGEKGAGMWAAPLGIALAALATWVFFRDATYKHTAWPLWLAGLAAGAIGIVLILKSDGQAQGVIDQIGNATAMATETARMERVVRNFTMLKILWCVLFVGSASATFVFDRPTVHAVAVGVAVIAAGGLLFDMVADARARVYLQALHGA